MTIKIKQHIWTKDLGWHDELKNIYNNKDMDSSHYG